MKYEGNDENNSYIPRVNKTPDNKSKSNDKQGDNHKSKDNANDKKKNNNADTSQKSDASDSELNNNGDSSNNVDSEDTSSNQKQMPDSHDNEGMNNIKSVQPSEDGRSFQSPKNERVHNTDSSDNQGMLANNDNVDENQGVVRNLSDKQLDNDSSILSKNSKSSLIDKTKLGANNLVHKGINGAKTLISATSKGVSTMAAKLGVSAKALTLAAAITGTSAGFIGVATIVGLNNEMDVAKYDGYEIDCSVEKKNAIQASGEQLDYNAQAEANAQYIYSVLSSSKLSFGDNEIAGVLGSAMVESHIDTTCIEGDYKFCPDEMYQIGPKKSKIFEDLNDYTLNSLFPYYDSIDFSVNKPAYKDNDGNYAPALGLWQWTGPRKSDFLDFAKNTNDWWLIDTQMSFLVKENRAHVLDWGSKKAEKDARSAAEWFREKWEGSTYKMSEAQDNAESIKSKFSSWTSDDATASSIIDMAQVDLTEASATGVKSSLEHKQCKNGSNADNIRNDSIADAAVSISWLHGHEEMATVNEISFSSDKGKWLCTQEYVDIHDIVLPGIQLYSSCDISVATAVRMAGADDSFIKGNTPAQKSYMTEHSDKWKKIVDVLTESNKDKLQPGDVLVTDGHIMIYVGGEAMSKRFSVEEYGSEGADPSNTLATVDGSITFNNYPGRGPHAWNAGVTYATVGDKRNYTVFRNIKPETNSKWKALVDAEYNMLSSAAPQKPTQPETTTKN